MTNKHPASSNQYPVSRIQYQESSIITTDNHRLTPKILRTTDKGVIDCTLLYTNEDESLFQFHPRQREDPGLGRQSHCPRYLGVYDGDMWED